MTTNNKITNKVLSNDEHAALLWPGLHQLATKYKAYGLDLTYQLKPTQNIIGLYIWAKDDNRDLRSKLAAIVLACVFAANLTVLFTFLSIFI